MSSDDISEMSCFYDEIIPDDILDKRGILVIGDTHFQTNAFVEGEALRKRCVEIAYVTKPSVIILLGDTLDTHETAKQSPFNQACLFIEQLSELAVVYVIIGNHDYINQHQFLSDKHFFNPLKKWHNVHIVDKPTLVRMCDATIPTPDTTFTICLCPYVAPGRLIEALDMLAVHHPDDWTLSKCIFGHHEIKNVMYRGRNSSVGDEWFSSLPLFISGHIHEACDIGDNVCYVGSSRQVAIDESPDKNIWHILFDMPDEDTILTYLKKRDIWISKIPLNLKGMKEIRCSYDNLSSFDFDMLNHYHIKLHITGLSSQFKIFKKSHLHAKMVREGIRIYFDPISDNSHLSQLVSENFDRHHDRQEQYTFEHILHSLVMTKPDPIKEIYQHIIDEKDRKHTTKLIFVGSKSDEG